MNARFNMMAERLPEPLVEMQVVPQLAPMVKLPDGKFAPLIEGENDHLPVVALLANPLVIIADRQVIL
jgi:hypothetical protein